MRNAKATISSFDSFGLPKESLQERLNVMDGADVQSMESEFCSPEPKLTPIPSRVLL